MVDGNQQKRRQLKNHLKWARIEVNGDGQNIPSEVEISKKGINYFIPIWMEIKPRFVKTPMPFPVRDE